MTSAIRSTGVVTPDLNCPRCGSASMARFEDWERAAELVGAAMVWPYFGQDWRGGPPARSLWADRRIKVYWQQVR